jgi:transcriptional regulator GlxA family with amidase domain
MSYFKNVLHFYSTQPAATKNNSFKQALIKHFDIAEDDNRHMYTDLDATLRYIDKEVEKIRRILTCFELDAEPVMFQVAVRRIIDQIAAIRAAITLQSAHVEMAETETIGDNINYKGLQTGAQSDLVFLRNLKRVVSSNITDAGLDVDRLSNLMNMSRRNLFRRIKSAAGVSPAEFINEIRLIIARGLLLYSDLKMYEIAERVGFKSRIVFTRNFSKLYGLSPTEFLKTISRNE